MITPIYTWRDGGTTYMLYLNRLEMQRPRILTMGLATKTEIVYFTDIHRVTRNRKSAQLHITALNSIGIFGRKKDLDMFMNTLSAAKYDRLKQEGKL